MSNDGLKHLKNLKKMRVLGQVLRVTIPGRQWAKRTKRYEIIVDGPDDPMAPWRLRLSLYMPNGETLTCDGSHLGLATAEQRCSKKLARLCWTHRHNRLLLWFYWCLMRPSPVIR